MYVIVIFMAAAMAVLGIGGLELALNYQHSVAQRTAGRLADQYMPRAESAYAQQIAALVQGGTTIVPGANANLASMGNSVCPNSGNTPCAYTADYAVTTTGSTGTGAATGVASNYVNTTLGEERIAATLTVTVRDAKGNAVAKRVRTFILRTIPGLSPYASVIDSTDTQDVYQTANTQHQALSEGDSTCNGAGCGDPTVINSYAACNWNQGTSLNATQVSMQKQWCSNPPAASYNKTGTADASGNWNQINTTSTANKALNNTNATTGGSN